MQVKDLMSGTVVSVRPEETVAEAARLLARHDVGAIPVCGEDGDLRGIVTDRDIILRCVASEEDPAGKRVSEVMTRNCATVSCTDDVRAAARIMSARQVRRLPVVEQGKVVGIVSLGDLSVSHTCDMETVQALSEISLARENGA